MCGLRRARGRRRVCTAGSRRHLEPAPNLEGIGACAFTPPTGERRGGARVFRPGLYVRPTPTPSNNSRDRLEVLIEHGRAVGRIPFGISRDLGRIILRVRRIEYLEVASD